MARRDLIGDVRRMMAENYGYLDSYLARLRGLSRSQRKYALRMLVALGEVRSFQLDGQGRSSYWLLTKLGRERAGLPRGGRVNGLGSQRLRATRLLGYFLADCPPGTTRAVKPRAELGEKLEIDNFPLSGRPFVLEEGPGGERSLYLIGVPGPDTEPRTIVRKCWTVTWKQILAHEPLAKLAKRRKLLLAILVDNAMKAQAIEKAVVTISHKGRTLADIIGVRVFTVRTQQEGGGDVRHEKA